MSSEFALLSYVWSKETETVVEAEGAARAVAAKKRVETTVVNFMAMIRWVVKKSEVVLV